LPFNPSLVIRQQAGKMRATAPRTTPALIRLEGDAVTGIIVDGSNVSRHSARGGKLTTLDNLARVINCLLKHGYEPFTVFDASFRWALKEESDGRLLFERLTKKVPEHFGMTPKGEEADLFILELAVSTGFPVLSNDTYGDYGKLRGNTLSYANEQVELNNYKIMAGTIIIPDRSIRYRFEEDDRHMAVTSDDEFAKLIARRESPESPVAETGPNDQDHGAERREDVEEEPFVGSARAAVFRVITRYLKEGSGNLGELGKRLREHRIRYMNASGRKDGGRIWFGFSSLKSFVAKNVAGFTVRGDRIVRDDEISDDRSIDD
jgi:hypothetical protein